MKPEKSLPWTDEYLIRRRYIEHGYYMSRESMADYLRYEYGYGLPETGITRMMNCACEQNGNLFRLACSKSEMVDIAIAYRAMYKGVN